ncbi:MAG: hypothetical protein ACJ748_08155 [Flavisolibacter sp.]
MIIDYGGIVNKPIPTVLFYFDTFNKKSLIFGVAYKITKAEFLKIEDLIMNSNLVQKVDSSKVGYYTLKITKNCNKNYFITANKINTMELVNNIQKQVKNYSMRKKVERRFQENLDRVL